MIRFMLRRVLSLIPTAFLIITFSFAIVRLAPGGPFSSEKNLPPEVVENLLKKYHMDEPLYRQYLRYLGDISLGDLGPSTRFTDFTVNEVIRIALPISMTLGVMALTLAVTLGISAGLAAAWKQNRWTDYLLMSFAVVGISVPLFVVGPVLKLYLALKWRLLPTSGWLGSRYGWVVIIMPVITLSLPYLASIARLTRASVLEVMRTDYIRAARAKGLSEAAVVRRHVLKGALLPVVSYLAPTFADIITGTVVVETIFTVPGLGRFYIQGAINRDYGLILGDVIVFSMILLVMNLAADLAYGFLDPRITYK